MTVFADNVSIVIATADRPQLLRDCIESWREMVPAQVELVVVDAGLKAPVAVDSITLLWPNSRVIRSSVRNAGIQRNTGVREANGDVIIFLDDDTTVNPGWWPAIVEPLTSLEADCVAGGVWCNKNPTFTDKRGGYVNWRGAVVQVTHRSNNAPRWVDWPMTTNMAVKRDAFLSVGGFCEAYGVYDEDVDFGLLLRRAGFGIYFEPTASVYHRFLERRRQPATKTSHFRDGRNRSMLLVRHYGFASRTLLALVLNPLLNGVTCIGSALAGFARAFVHTGAYALGLLCGVWMGLRNSLKEDVEKWRGENLTTENTDGTEGE